MSISVGEQMKEKNRTGFDPKRGKSKRREKRQASRKLRRLAKCDPEGAPRKRAFWGWGS